MLEPATPLHLVGQNRRRNWKNGAPAHVLNALEQRRTVGAFLHDGALIGSFTRMAVEMAVNQGLVEPFFRFEVLVFWLVQAKFVVAAAGFEPATRGL